MLPENAFICPHFQLLYVRRRRSSRAIRLGRPDHVNLPLLSTNLAHSIPHVRGVHRHTMSFPLECIEESIQQCHKILRGDSIIALHAQTLVRHSTLCAGMEFVAGKVTL